MIAIRLFVLILMGLNIFSIRSGLAMMRTGQDPTFEEYPFKPAKPYTGTRKGKAIYYQGVNGVVKGVGVMLGLVLIAWDAFISGAITIILLIGIAIVIMSFFTHKPIANLVIAQLHSWGVTKH